MPSKAIRFCPETSDPVFISLKLVTEDPVDVLAVEEETVSDPLKVAEAVPAVLLAVNV